MMEWVQYAVLGLGSRGRGSHVMNFAYAAMDMEPCGTMDLHHASMVADLGLVGNHGRGTHVMR